MQPSWKTPKPYLHIRHVHPAILFPFIFIFPTDLWIIQAERVSMQPVYAAFLYNND